MLVVAIMSVMPMVSEIYDQMGYTSLGKINIVVIYIAYCSTSCLVPSLIANWKYKTALVVGSLGFIFTMVAGVLTTACDKNSEYFWCSNHSYIYALNIGCSFINGATEPILWLSANAYVTGCTNETNKGRYIGIFWSFVSAACVIASLLTALCIKFLGQFQFFVGALGFTCLASIMFALAPNVSKYTKEKSGDTVLNQLKRIGKLATSKKMIPFLPYMVLVGLLLAIYNAFEYEIIVKIIPDFSDEEQNYITSLILSVEGAVTIVASYVVGALSDKMKPKGLTALFNIFAVFAIISSFLSIYWGSLPGAYIMASLWGISYTASRTLTPIILAKDFNGSMESFAIAQFVCNFATALGSMLCIYITNITVFLMVIGGFLLVAQVGLCFYKGDSKAEENNEKETLDEKPYEDNCL